ncbi:hypothetical protein LguiA_004396 [Lonicera macranthoides]
MSPLKRPRLVGPTEPGLFKLVRSGLVLSDNSVRSGPKYYRTEVAGPVQTHGEWSG